MNYKDYTLKAKANSLMKIEIILKKLGATFLGVDNQKDTYFNTSNGKLKLRRGTIENLITHYERTQEKGLEKTAVYRYDVNPTEEEVSLLFQNHAVIGIVEKERKIYFLDTIKIHLDTTAENKLYVEIEAFDQTGMISNETLLRQCLDLKEKLEISDDDLIRTGYLPEKN